MNRTRALHHLRALAETCADMTTRPIAIHPLRVDGLWVAGELLGPAGEVEAVTVALTVDVPEVPWRTEPHGARHWAQATRLPQLPFTAYWRSARAPVWNHVLHRPLPVWSADGVREDVLDALAAGDVEALREPAPSEEETAARLRDELDVSLRALTERTAEYERRRWKPGKLEPFSDALWQASAGYLDLLRATSGDTE
ncbi:DUF7711 family protein [Actinokineospora enzanensis]|uniref:DUF7711 family protein n=1 Tax=Actinokineospora enzanensis TaxID=155975 RepID=UPI0003641AC4|nr:hypothetical protein [Actinokineospora enzanensis]